MNKLSSAIKEHDVVTLNQDLSDYYLYKGDKGVIIYIYLSSETFGVEVLSENEISQVVTLQKSQFTKEKKNEK